MGNKIQMQCTQTNVIWQVGVAELQQSLTALNHDLTPDPADIKKRFLKTPSHDACGKGHF